MDSTPTTHSSPVRRFLGSAGRLIPYTGNLLATLIDKFFTILGSELGADKTLLGISWVVMSHLLTAWLFC